LVVFFLSFRVLCFRVCGRVGNGVLFGVGGLIAVYQPKFLADLGRSALGEA